MDRSPEGPAGPDHAHAERLAKAWITRLVERTPLRELGTVPLGQLGDEAPSLIITALGALSDPARGPGELAHAGQQLAELFGEAAERAPAAGRDTPADEAAPAEAAAPARKVAPPAEVAGADEVTSADRGAAVNGDAPVDEVTGLPGPEGLDRCLGGLLAEQRRYGQPFSLALVDVDGLARVNEAHGRKAGDRMLAAVAAILRRQLREVDFLFRTEDDEFAIVAPHTGPARLVPMAQRVAKLIADSQDPDGPRLAVAAGVVGCPADGVGADRLLESATEAIYAAKASGVAVARTPSGSSPVLQDS